MLTPLLISSGFNSFTVFLTVKTESDGWETKTNESDKTTIAITQEGRWGQNDSQKPGNKQEYGKELFEQIVEYKNEY